MLRDYQQAAVHKVDRAWYRLFPTKRVGIQLPPGAGKTVIAEAVINQALWREPKARVLFVCHTKKIASQAIARLSGPGTTTSQVGDNSHDYTGQVVVGIINSLDDCPSHFTHIIVDEAHLFDNDRFARLLRRLGDVRILGLSATYERKPSWMQRIVYKQSPTPLVRQGHLAKPIVKRVSAKNFQQAFAIWQRTAGNRRTIIFANDTNESYLLSLYMQSKGINAVHVSGSTSPADRAWAEQHAQVIVNCMVYREGADLPNIGCVMLLTDEKRQAHFIQKAGRGSRPDTPDYLILCVNCRTHKLEMR